MGKTDPILVCKDPKTIEIYDCLQFDSEYSAENLDRGYLVLDYSRSQTSFTTGQEDGQVQCEEIWEEALKRLDEYASRVDGREDAEEAKGLLEKEAVWRHQNLRRLIESKVGRPISWVLEAPYVGVTEQERQELKTKAKEIRKKVNRVIDHFNILLANIPDPQERDRRLIIGLFWFVYTSDQKGNFISNEARLSLETNGLSDFIPYLETEGGFGMVDTVEDASREATALETVLYKKGWCTEKSKVLYAVLRMAGVKAFFVEPRLDAYYFAKEKNLSLMEGRIPLQGHIASGVGVKIKNKKGDEEKWILDITLKMLVANYVSEYPFWELSLRHFLTVDLSNSCRDLRRAGIINSSKESCETALSFGEDSMARSVMTNYAVLLEDAKIESTEELNLACHSPTSCHELAYFIDPNTLPRLYNHALILKRQNAEEALEIFFQVFEIDPRFLEPFRHMIDILNSFYSKPSLKPKFNLHWQRFDNLLKETKSKYGKANWPSIRKRWKIIFNVILSEQEFKKTLDPNLVEMINKLLKTLGIDR